MRNTNNSNPINRVYTIYSLVDPETMKVKYVGCSLDPKARYSLHLREEFSRAKARWIADLKARELKPILRTETIKHSLPEAKDEEIRVFDKYNTGELTCADPRRRPYVANGATPRITNKNKKEVSKFVVDNIKQLLVLNKLSLTDLAKAGNVRMSDLKLMLTGEVVLDVQFVQRVISVFNTDQSRLILPNQIYAFDDNKNKRLTNRCSIAVYSRKYRKLLKELGLK